MRNRLSIYAALLLGLSGTLATSCKKDFLTKNPLNAISGETFWKNETDVNLALAGVYSRLQTGFSSYNKVYLDGYSDNAYDRFGYFGFNNMTTGVVNPTNVPGTFYDPPYQGIAACNFFLKNVDKAPIGDATKKIYKAEVQFLRAHFYMELVQAFGDVVLYKKAPATVDAAKIPAAPKSEVLAFIHEDLDFAIATLPDTKYDGHAVKGSAMGLKVKAFLLQEKWSEAAALAQQLITGGKFSLSPSYSGLFITSTQQNNPEILFSTRYLAPNNVHAGGEGLETEVGWYGSIGVYANLGDDYECTDGKSITESPLYNPATPYANRDPRMDITLKLPGEKYINPDGTEFQHSDPVLTPYLMQKYLDMGHLPFTRGGASISTDQNIIHIRFADVLLMYAEAKNEASGPDASVYNAIDQVRGRAEVNMPPVDRLKYASKDALRQYIRHERRIELACEGLRYFDLKRWNQMAERLALVKNPAGAQLSYGEKNNVLPFPQGEIDKNPQLKQKQGYN
ncbi:RagB/SusD family nutrient uptake outer membrane protein [Chitinophaga caseinilytica]|uniref:RagB/SusD family nutrient uptake outer membrane protein n=1 Tax=Chitinophaga caseinilytica TaxID=2267521 RepID=A0ABZ2Z0M2_9BACT